MSRIFLGGTCNNSTWRNTLIDHFPFERDWGYFNPVVEDWTEDCIAIENDEKANKCDIHLYVITEQMKGVYSIAELINSCHDDNKTTVFCVIEDDFDKAQLKSLKAVGGLVDELNGVSLFIEDASELKVLSDVLQNTING